MVDGYFWWTRLYLYSGIIVLLLRISSDELQNIHRYNYREALSVMMIAQRNLGAFPPQDLN